MRIRFGRISTAALLLLLLLPSLARATVYPCTEAGLDSGLAAGGLVQFSCTGAATIPITSSKTVSVSGTNLDGQGRVTFQGNAGFQLFVVTSGASVTFQRLTITGASLASLGAVLSGNVGTNVSLNRVRLNANNATTGGAVIYSSSGSVTITNSTISGINSNGNAFVGDTATLSMTSSTISGMLRGVVARSGTTATISHSTIVGANTGVQAVGATDSISIGHVLFSSNAVDISGTTVMSAGFNVIEDAFAGGQATDMIGVPARVAALASNGGPTETVALLACSPAIDAGQTPATLPTDQRGTGFPRVLQARQDIGAFESSFTALPCITTQPLPQTVFATQTVTLTVAAITGTGTLTFQWRLGGTPIAGATNTSFMIAMAAVTDAGDYDVVVSNGAGSVTSQPAHVTVEGPPVVTTNPLAVTLFVGQPLLLTIGATGNMLSYTWRQNGAALAPQTAAMLSVAAVTLQDAGSYDCVVTNPAGSVTSESAAVTVNGPPVITKQPVGVAVTEGDSFELVVEATGGSLAYQWQKDGVQVANATSASFNVAMATMADVGNYSVVVTNPAGSVTSDTATVTTAAIQAQHGGGCGCNLGGKASLPRGILLLVAALMILAAIRCRRVRPR